MTGYSCDRISIGPFERGPIHVVWDAHGNADVPESCQVDEAANTADSILGTFMIDDQEVATYLREEFGIPAIVGVFDVDASQPPVLTWSWGPEGQSVSSLTFVDDGTTSSILFPDRLFWPRGSGIGQIDLTPTGSIVAYTSRMGTGPMSSPMLLAETQPNPFVGPTSYMAELAVAAQIALFSDSLCGEPEPLT